MKVDLKAITFYFDFISPYAYLAFEALPKSLQGISCSVNYQPVLFAGLLKHHGQLGPAEIRGKREWTYRQVLWQARENGIALDLPESHPFNPLGLLRLALACSPHQHPNRRICEAIFRHAWRGGAPADDPDRLAHLTEKLQPQYSVDDLRVKEQLKTYTEQALARGVFGVPTLEVDGQLFWGLDSLSMLKAYLQGDGSIPRDCELARRVRPGVKRGAALNRVGGSGDSS